MKYIIFFPQSSLGSHEIFNKLGAMDSFCHSIGLWSVTLDEEQLTVLNLTYPGLNIYRKIQ